MAFKMKGFSPFDKEVRPLDERAKTAQKKAEEKNIEVKDGKYIITYEDGSKADMSKVTRGGKTLLEHYRAGTL